MNKDLLKKFDEFVKAEKLDSYEIVISLMERALERASRKLWAISGKVPGEIDDTLRYIAFNCSENRIQFSESVEGDCYDTLRSAGLEDDLFIKNDEAFIEEDPDYQSLIDKFLKEKEKADKEYQEAINRENERAIEQLLSSLKNLGVTNEQIVERLKNEK